MRSRAGHGKQSPAVHKPPIRCPLRVAHGYALPKPHITRGPQMAGKKCKPRKGGKYGK